MRHCHCCLLALAASLLTPATMPASRAEPSPPSRRAGNRSGEAIYRTRPWTVFGEGPTETPEGHLADLKFKGFSPEDIRFTRTRDQGTLYAILRTRLGVERTEIIDSRLTLGGLVGM